MASDNLSSQLYNKPEHRHILVGNWQEEQKLQDTTGSHRYKVYNLSLCTRTCSRNVGMSDHLSAFSPGLPKTRSPPSMPQGKTSQSSCPLLKGFLPMMRGWYIPVDKLYIWTHVYEHLCVKNQSLGGYMTFSYLHAMRSLRNASAHDQYLRMISSLKCFDMQDSKDWKSQSQATYRSKEQRASDPALYNQHASAGIRTQLVCVNTL